MQCLVCNAKWQIGNIQPKINSCPICDIDFASNDDKRKIESIKELFLILIDQYGIDIALDSKRICGYLNDYFPEKSTEREEIKNLLDQGIGEFLYQNYQKATSDSIRLYLESLMTSLDIDVISDVVEFLLKTKVSNGTEFDSKRFFLDYYSESNDLEYKKLSLAKAKELEGSDEDSLKLTKILLYGEETVDYLAARESVNAMSDSGEKELLLGICDYHLDKINDAKDHFLNASRKDCYDADIYLYNIYISEGQTGKALDHLKVCSDSGNSGAMYEYALHLLYGDDVKEDVKQAIDLLEKSANSGYEDAKKKIAYMYMTGYKVNKDKDKARSFMER